MTRILPTDTWTPESGKTYTLAPGTHNAVFFRQSVENVTIVGEPGALTRPQPPYLCGVYVDDRMSAINVRLYNLDIAGASVDGIRFWGDHGIEIVNCSVRSCLNQGIALHGCTNCLVTGCRISWNGYGDRSDIPQAHGIYASGNWLQIIGNNIWRNRGWGVHLWEEAYNSQVVENKISGHVRGAGIVCGQKNGIPNGGNTFARNHIDGGSGITLRGGGDYRLIDNVCTNVPPEKYALDIQKCKGPVLLVGEAGGKVWDPDGRMK